VALRALSDGDSDAALVALLRQEAAATLGHDSGDAFQAHVTFPELGMDSLAAAEFAGRIQKRLGVMLSSAVFDHPSFEQLAAFLRQARPADPNPAPPSALSSPGIIGHSPRIEPEVFEFQRAAYPRRRREWIEPRWRWMFLESARRLGREPQVWLYRHESRVVGHHGAIPVNVKIGPDERSSAWFVDTNVLEDFRSQAIGSRLSARAQDDVPFALSLGQTAQMREVQIKLGWRAAGTMDSWLLVLNARRALAGRLKRPAVRLAVAGALQATQSARRLLNRSSPKGTFDVALIARFDDGHDRLWASVRHQYGCAVVRDASYLNWKYVDQPGQSFRRIEVRHDGQVVAVAVMVLHDPDEARLYRRAIVVDFVALHDNAAVVQAALEALAADAAQLQADVVEFDLLSTSLAPHLRTFGFTRAAKTRQLLVWRRTGDPAAHGGDDATPDDWYLTRGDSDGDNPWGTPAGREPDEEALPMVRLTGQAVEPQEAV
jgi:hypothetical protein